MTSPNPPDSVHLATAHEVAALLQMPLKSVYHLVETREIPFVRIGRRVRFMRGDVLAWIAKHRVPSLEQDQ